MGLTSDTSLGFEKSKAVELRTIEFPLTCGYISLDIHTHIGNAPAYRCNESVWRSTSHPFRRITFMEECTEGADGHGHSVNTTAD